MSDDFADEILRECGISDGLTDEHWWTTEERGKFTRAIVLARVRTMREAAAKSRLIAEIYKSTDNPYQCVGAGHCEQALLARADEAERQMREDGK